MFKPFQCSSHPHFIRRDVLRSHTTICDWVTTKTDVTTNKFKISTKISNYKRTITPLHIIVNPEHVFIVLVVLYTLTLYLKDYKHQIQEHIIEKTPPHTSYSYNISYFRQYKYQNTRDQINIGAGVIQYLSCGIIKRRTFY